MKIKISTEERIYLLLRRPLKQDEFYRVCTHIDFALSQYHHLMSNRTLLKPCIYPSHLNIIKEHFPKIIDEMPSTTKNYGLNQRKFAQTTYDIPIYLAELFQCMINDIARPSRIKSFTTEDLRHCWQFLKKHAPMSKIEVAHALSIFVGASGIGLSGQDLDDFEMCC